jgi:hypothetical protein
MPPSVVFKNIFTQVGAGDIWFGKRIYGERRHPLLTKQAGLADLIAMGCPCRLVFDDGRRIDGPVLARHPDSEGRHPDIGEKKAMPDTAAPVGTTLTPVDLSGIDAFGYETVWVPDGAASRTEVPGYALAETLPGRNWRGRRDYWTRDRAAGELQTPEHLRQRGGFAQAAVDRAVAKFGPDYAGEIRLMPVSDDGFRFIEPQARLAGALGLRRAVRIAGRKARVEIEVSVHRSGNRKFTTSEENALVDFVLFAAAADRLYVSRSRENEGRPLSTVEVSLTGGTDNVDTVAVLGLCEAVMQAMPGWSEPRKTRSPRTIENENRALWRARGSLMPSDA